MKYILSISAVIGLILIAWGAGQHRFKAPELRQQVDLPANCRHLESLTINHWRIPDLGLTYDSASHPSYQPSGHREGISERRFKCEYGVWTEVLK